MSISEQVLQALQGDGISNIASQLGVDSETATKAVSSALPALLGALSHNASDDKGADSLFNALSSDHDGSALDDPISALLNGPGAGILKHLFGDQQDEAANLVGKSSGLMSGQSLKLMMMLAPLVLGALGKVVKSGGSKGDVVKDIESSTKAAHDSQPDILGGLGSIIGGLGGSSQSGSGLGSILGKILGG